MKAKLERLIQLLHKRRFSEKIAAARTPKEAKRIYKREWKFIAKQVESFKKDAEKTLEIKSYVVDDSFEITAKNAVEIGWISFMTGIDEVNLVENWDDIPSELRKVVKKETSIMAKKMANILDVNMLTSYNLIALLEELS